MQRTLITVLAVIAGLSAGCSDQPWNNPYPEAEAKANVLYTSFSERPKHLDPVRSYSSNEYAIIANIYEPPLQYHYLKRPYQLTTLTAIDVPQPRFYSKDGILLPSGSAETLIDRSVFEIKIKPGIYYQPHPALARDEQGRLNYHALDENMLEDIYALSDFKKTGTRELTADDYVYQIKRMAHPALHSPIFGVMREYIVGLDEYAKVLKNAWLSEKKAHPDAPWLDLRSYALAGVQATDRYTYTITVKGKYPQLLYWLAMPFFAPMPWEAEAFHAQPGMKDKNLTLDWYPIGTGPFMLTVNNPNRQMVMARNPNFHGEVYPEVGEPEDRITGLLKDAGQPLPFIDKLVMSLEKESIPYWNKFLQGYYDASGVSSDVFDQAINVSAQGEVGLTDAMRAKGIDLKTAVSASTYYFGFNMFDPVVGAPAGESGKKLRHAISIAVDYEEYISIFLNGRGIAAQSPLPPGIFGYQDGKAGINSVVYEWRNDRPYRRPIEQAQTLLAEAGYPDGRDVKTGEPLTLYYDTVASGPDDKARLSWFRKQFAKLSIQLVVRSTDYNRFQEKMLKGNAQMFSWGWNADYPDPENFLFLLYGPNGKVNYQGENAANYTNPEFDALFSQMKNMDNSPVRAELVDRMIAILREDAPWLWGFHQKSFSLHHAWYYNSKPHLMANNTLKYKRIDPELRQQMRVLWNQPVWWPVVLVFVLLVISAIPAIRSYRHALYSRGVSE